MGFFDELAYGFDVLRDSLDYLGDTVKEGVSDLKDTVGEAIEAKLEDVKDDIQDIDWEEKAEQAKSTFSEIKSGLENVGGALAYAGRDISGVVLGYEDPEYKIGHYDDNDDDVHCNTSISDDAMQMYNKDLHQAEENRKSGNYSEAITILDDVNSTARTNGHWEIAYKAMHRARIVLKECETKNPSAMSQSYRDFLNKSSKLREYEAMLYIGKLYEAETQLTSLAKRDDSDAEHAAAILTQYYKTVKNKSQYRYWYNLGVKKWGYPEDNEWDYEMWL